MHDLVCGLETSVLTNPRLIMIQHSKINTELLKDKTLHSKELVNIGAARNRALKTNSTKET